ncbi:MAG TPA: amidohydrolase family protein, partial [Thermoplasmata archaeon]|nr:amidohydrolase family protein [Thermoplasmata archaeon]
MKRRASRGSSRKRAHKQRRVGPRKLSGGKLIVAHAAELLTLQGPNRPRCKEEMRNIGIIYDGAVVIDSGRIREVGKTEEILRRHRGRVRVIDASGKVVMPGFVDPHTHVAFAGSRHEEVAMKVAGLTYREIAARGGGILKTVADTRAAPKAELL